MGVDWHVATYPAVPRARSVRPHTLQGRTQLPAPVLCGNTLPQELAGWRPRSGPGTDSETLPTSGHVLLPSGALGPLLSVAFSLCTCERGHTLTRMRSLRPRASHEVLGVWGGCFHGDVYLL